VGETVAAGGCFSDRCDRFNCSTSAGWIRARDDCRGCPGESSFRWPGLSILFCVLTAASMVMSIQFGFTARAFFYSPGDVANWWPEASEDSGRRAWLKSEHERHFEQWRRYATRARLAYNTGACTLTLSLFALAAPPTGARQAPLRWAAALLSLIATVTIVTTAVRRTRVDTKEAAEEP
jgi:hypothetical protein